MALTKSNDDETKGASVAVAAPRRSAGRTTEISTGQWLLGMIQATTFSCVYFFAPIYMIATLVCLLRGYCTRQGSFIMTAPLVLSIFSKPKKIDCRFLKPMADYFDFETAFEMPDDDVGELLQKSDKKFILASQPHEKDTGITDRKGLPT